ncbi:acyl carrier protein [Paenibacillus peoriae]|uniref:acyl carrier protein n=1 Tax=Paenibacillus peoriae TaxID=59893 RepID=UPI00096F8038|nr:acyl carrier protein [Paenibacillus peoriae]OMF49989.1 acyl carrier protein [Paenibacillus peoriae]
MMNLEKYNEIFMTCFELDESKLNDDLLYNSIPAWDSVGHMGMIAAIEESFDIMMDTDDIIDFSSYQKGKEIMKKYDVEL